jgi:hypothetical protein
LWIQDTTEFSLEFPHQVRQSITVLRADPDPCDDRAGFIRHTSAFRPVELLAIPKLLSVAVANLHPSAKVPDLLLQSVGGAKSLITIEYRGNRPHTTFGDENETMLSAQQFKSFELSQCHHPVDQGIRITFGTSRHFSYTGTEQVR